ncbi:MAG: hypothetical protein QG577_2427 [Thermodesulfobacteriota bacterium]|nr:hypothetical protein [Thermodesulfobacteriota bacterium]
MNCEKCNAVIEPGEEREHFGKVLCEDCYMDALSPARTCDPWAVHSAKSLKEQTGRTELNEVQEKILEILKETSGIEPGLLAKRLGIKPADLEREIAALRHMEQVRGELRDGRKVLILW